MAKIKKDAAQESAKGSSEKGASGEPKMSDQKKKEKKEKGEKRAAKAKIFRDRIAHAAELVKTQKYTDEAIIAEVNEKFPEYAGKKFDKKECDRARWMIKNNLIRDLDTAEWPYERCVEHEGKVYSRSKKPKPPKKSRKKVDKEDDPLNKTAGVDVHGDKSEGKKNKEKA